MKKLKRQQAEAEEAAAAAAAGDEEETEPPVKSKKQAAAAKVDDEPAKKKKKKMVAKEDTEEEEDAVEMAPSHTSLSKSKVTVGDHAAAASGLRFTKAFYKENAAVTAMTSKVRAAASNDQPPAAQVGPPRCLFFCSLAHNRRCPQLGNSTR